MPRPFPAACPSPCFHCCSTADTSGRRTRAVPCPPPPPPVPFPPAVPHPPCFHGRPPAMQSCRRVLAPTPGVHEVSRAPWSQAGAKLCLSASVTVVVQMQRSPRAHAGTRAFTRPRIKVRARSCAHCAQARTRNRVGEALRRRRYQSRWQARGAHPRSRYGGSSRALRQWHSFWAAAAGAASARAAPRCTPGRRRRRAPGGSAKAGTARY